MQRNTIAFLGLCKSYEMEIKVHKASVNRLETILKELNEEMMKQYDEAEISLIMSLRTMAIVFIEIAKLKDEALQK